MRRGWGGEGGAAIRGVTVVGTLLGESGWCLGPAIRGITVPNPQYQQHYGAWPPALGSWLRYYRHYGTQPPGRGTLGAVSPTIRVITEPGPCY